MSQQLLPGSATRKETRPFQPLRAPQCEAGSPRSTASSWNGAFRVGALRRQGDAASPGRRRRWARGGDRRLRGRGRVCGARADRGEDQGKEARGALGPGFRPISPAHPASATARGHLSARHRVVGCPDSRDPAADRRPRACPARGASAPRDPFREKRSGKPASTARAESLRSAPQAGGSGMPRVGRAQPGFLPPVREPPSPAFPRGCCASRGRDRCAARARRPAPRAPRGGGPGRGAPRAPGGRVRGGALRAPGGRVGAPARPGVG